VVTTPDRPCGSIDRQDGDAAVAALRTSTQAAGTPSAPVPVPAQPAAGRQPAAVATQAAAASVPPPTPPPKRSPGAWWSALYAGTQVALLAILFVGYQLGRRLAEGDEPRAFDNASELWHVERLLHLPSEQTMQQLALRSIELIKFANDYYIFVHFPVAIGFLAWVFVRHRDHWSRVRNVIILATGAALVIHIVYPLAPPRFLPSVVPGVDLIDTGLHYGPTAYSSGDTLANQYAAMPSLHVGWAILEAWAIITILRSRWRWLALAQPILTTLVVVVTANHYWLDGALGGLLVFAAVMVTSEPVRLRVTAIAHLIRDRDGLALSGAEAPKYTYSGRDL
jgi:hypothetical protein